jgi:hypothetical protein
MSNLFTIHKAIRREDGKLQIVNEKTGLVLWQEVEDGKEAAPPTWNMPAPKKNEAA